MTKEEIMEAVENAEAIDSREIEGRHYDLYTIKADGNEISVIDNYDYSNVRDAIAKHVDNEDKNTVAIRDGIQGNPNKTVINDTWSFKVDNQTGKIIPYEGGLKFMLSGFNPENMRKKLATVDEAKAKAARDARTA